MANDKTRAYLLRNGVSVMGFSDRGVDTRAIEMAMGNIGRRVHEARMDRDDATLETIASGLVALDAEGEA
jgi:hypothetical protein